MIKEHPPISQQADTLLPTQWGEFVLTAFTNHAGDYTPHLVLHHPTMDITQPVVVRMHSECITGDIFHSLKCDCGQQLDYAMHLIAQHKGVLIYLRQEGRGIGIINKIRAYKHQEQGMNTIEANEALGLESDYRHYDEAVAILKELGIQRIKLITNNPEKLSELSDGGIEIVDRIPVVMPPNLHNSEYLDTKKQAMGHLL